MCADGFGTNADHSEWGFTVKEGARFNRRVSGAERDHWLSKARVKHDGAWSPNGWLTVLCYRLCPRLEISLESNSVQTLQKSFG